MLVGLVAGFVMSFVFLFITYSAGTQLLVEQLLFEYPSRARAFFEGYVRPYRFPILVAWALAFAISWSEFYITQFTVALDPVKPFAVVLAAAEGEFTTNYSVFATGAILSFLICLILPLLAALGLQFTVRERR